MKTDPKKLRELLAGQVPLFSVAELRREENVFLVGGDLPERETLETLFDSHYQCHAALFHLTFGDINRFHNGESLARVIKKNFNVHLVGRLDYATPRHLVERAYAAGVDFIDIPLPVFDRARSREAGYAVEERLSSLEYALSVFPRWTVVSTLTAGEEPPCSTVAGIDALLGAGILPMVTLSPRAAHYPLDEVAGIFSHLAQAWRRHRAAVKPLLPLVFITAPLVPNAPRTGLRSFIDTIDDRYHLAASDLRRILRVKEVAQSFDSAGL